MFLCGGWRDGARSACVEWSGGRSGQVGIVLKVVDNEAGEKYTGAFGSHSSACLLRDEWLDMALVQFQG